MQPGIYRGLTNEEYHGGPGVSKSMLDVLAQSSPLHLYYLRNVSNDRPTTPAQMIGTAFHALLLEPASFAAEYTLALRQEDVPDAVSDAQVLVDKLQALNAGRLAKLPTSGSKQELAERIAENRLILPDKFFELPSLSLAELKAIISGANEDRDGLLSVSGTRHEMAARLIANGVPVTLWSDVKDEWDRNNGHRKVLTQEQWDQLHRMRDAVMAHPAASKLLTSSNNVIVDVKTCEDASLEGFTKSITGWRYHVQDAMYLEGVRLALEQSGHEPPAEGEAELSVYWTDPATGELCRCRPDFWRGQPKHFVFLAVEKSACVVNGQAKGVATYRLDDTSRELGRRLFRQAMDTYAACLSSGVWPGYSDRVENITVSNWELARNANLMDQAG